MGGNKLNHIIMLILKDFIFSFTGKAEKAEIRKDRLIAAAYIDDLESLRIFPCSESAQTSPDLCRAASLSRAEFMLGHKGYNLMFKNCEHFVFWCALHPYLSISWQVFGVYKKLAHLVFALCLGLLFSAILSPFTTTILWKFVIPIIILSFTLPQIKFVDVNIEKLVIHIMIRYRHWEKVRPMRNNLAKLNEYFNKAKQSSEQEEENESVRELQSLLHTAEEFQQQLIEQSFQDPRANWEETWRRTEVNQLSLHLKLVEANLTELSIKLQEPDADIKLLSEELLCQAKTLSNKVLPKFLDSLKDQWKRSEQLLFVFLTVLLPVAEKCTTPQQIANVSRANRCINTFADALLQWTPLKQEQARCNKINFFRTILQKAVQITEARISPGNQT